MEQSDDGLLAALAEAHADLAARLDRLEAAHSILRIDLMARLDRLQATLTEQREPTVVPLRDR